jgi:hypothetical protein
MPVYLCKPGWDAPEPWRHGIQVYAYPFSIPEQPTTASSPSREGRSQSDDAEGASSPQREESSSSLAAQDGHGIVTTQHTTHHKGEVRTRGIKYGMPVRRVRHAEVVLVDQVSPARRRVRTPTLLSPLSEPRPSYQTGTTPQSNGLLLFYWYEHFPGPFSEGVKIFCFFCTFVLHYSLCFSFESLHCFFFS